jgi:hypothetical protein
MKNWKWIFAVCVVAILAFAVSSYAQETTIGVFFDEDATQYFASFNGGFGEVHTAYVFVTNAEQMVGGMAFKLDLDPQIMLLQTEYPAGLAIGNILTGVEIGLNEPVTAYYGVPALAATLTMTTFENLMDNAPLTVTTHPDYAAPIISDHNGYLREVLGWTSYLSIPVSNDNVSWGSVKALYN